MSHTWDKIKGSWGNQDWDYRQSGEVYVTITEKCSCCNETRKVRFKRVFKQGEVI